MYNEIRGLFRYRILVIGFDCFEDMAPIYWGIFLLVRYHCMNLVQVN
jgi:hypothetical protein